MVTRVEESKKSRIPASNSFIERQNSKYYISEVIKGYLNKESLVRDHLFNSLYFLELLVKYNNTSDYAADKPIVLPQKPFYKGIFGKS